MAELINEVTDHPFRVPPATEGELMAATDGPDDLWPGDDFVNDRLSIDESNSPQLQVTSQWGLRLPNGVIRWNMWQGIPFGNPLDRMKMVATLQKTAADVGLSPGEQTDQFLSKYHWVTRNQRAAVVYEETGAYPLTDPLVSALGTPQVDESPDDVPDPENSLYAALSTRAPNGQNPDVGLRPGSVGGDAQ